MNRKSEIFVIESNAFLIAGDAANVTYHLFENYSFEIP